MLIFRNIALYCVLAVLIACIATLLYPLLLVALVLILFVIPFRPKLDLLKVIKEANAKKNDSKQPSSVGLNGQVNKWGKS